MSENLHTSRRHSLAKTSPLWPLAVGVAALLASVAGLLIVAFGRTGGVVVYGLDDPYIHMAVAANLLHSGTWGINPGEFAGTSSSPLWTLILTAAFRIFGQQDALPLLLNVAAAIGLVALWWRMLRGRLRPVELSIFLVIAAGFVCLTMLAIVGMEHSLHALLAVAAMSIAADVGSGESAKNGRRTALLCILMVALVACRFESVAIGVAIALILMARRRFLSAVVILVTTFLPVAIYAVFSFRHGGDWLPNSVLLKAGLPQPHGRQLAEMIGSIPGKLRRAPHMFAMGLAGVFALWALWNDRSPVAQKCRGMLGIFLLCTLAHLQFAQTGWLYRYEAYLIAMGLPALAIAASLIFQKPDSQVELRGSRPSFPMRIIFTLSILVAGGLLAVRTCFATRDTLGAPRNIFEQQYQMARFVREELGGQAVAVNDIGAVGYYGNARVLDLWGLADAEVFRARRAGTYSTGFIVELCRRGNAHVAIVYDTALAEFGGIPPGWVKVEQWKTQDLVLRTSDTVSFYAVDAAAQADLAAALDRFRRQLPARVIQTRPFHTGDMGAESKQ